MGAGSTGEARPAGRLLLRFLELQIPMTLGAATCLALGRSIADATGIAASYRPGTYAYAAGDVFFLTVPVAAWMLLRGRGRRHSGEIVLAMVAPIAVIALIGEVAGYPYLPWLVAGMYPAMSVGIGVVLLYRSSPRGAGRWWHAWLRQA